MLFEKSRLFALAFALLLDKRRPWQQGIQKLPVFVFHMVWNDSEQQFKILVGVQAVCFCRFYQAVDHCAGFRTMIGRDQDEVLPADGERAYRLLRRIVVHGDIAVGKEDPEIFLLVDAVGKGFSGCALMGHLGVFMLCPLKVGIHFFLQDNGVSDQRNQPFRDQRNQPISIMA